jgi:hypothetical protein
MLQIVKPRFDWQSRSVNSKKEIFGCGRFH